MLLMLVKAVGALLAANNRDICVSGRTANTERAVDVGPITPGQGEMGMRAGKVRAKDIPDIEIQYLPQEMLTPSRMTP